MEIVTHHEPRGGIMSAYNHDFTGSSDNSDFGSECDSFFPRKKLLLPNPRRVSFNLFKDNQNPEDKATVELTEDGKMPLDILSFCSDNSFLSLSLSRLQRFLP